MDYDEDDDLDSDYYDDDEYNDDSHDYFQDTKEQKKMSERLTSQRSHPSSSLSLDGESFNENIFP